MAEIQPSIFKPQVHSDSTKYTYLRHRLKNRGYNGWGGAVVVYEISKIFYNSSRNTGPCLLLEKKHAACIISIILIFFVVIYYFIAIIFVNTGYV